jgi:hypothetical protein
MLAGLAGWYLTLETEPRYQGKKLSEWLDVCGSPTYDSIHHRYTRPVPSEAVNAVRQIGTNALPTLLRWVCDGSSPAERLFFHTPAVLRPVRTESWLNERGARQMRRRESLSWILADTAKPIIGQLEEILTATPSTDAAALAAEALSFMGREGLDGLIRALSSTNTSPKAQTWILSSLRYTSADAKNDGGIPLPLLVKYLDSTDQTQAIFAAETLGNYALEPELVLPGLCQAMKSRDEHVRRFCVRAAGQYEKCARPWIAEVEPALKDVSLLVRKEAELALERINKE